MRRGDGGAVDGAVPCKRLRIALAQKVAAASCWHMRVVRGAVHVSSSSIGAQAMLAEREAREIVAGVVGIGALAWFVAESSTRHLRGDKDVGAKRSAVE